MTKPDEVTPLAEIKAVASDKLEQLLAVLVSQNRQPCMSGDMRDRLSSMQRRQVSDAALDIMEELITPLHVALHQAEARRASNAEMLAALRALLSGCEYTSLDGRPAQWHTIAISRDALDAARNIILRAEASQ